MFLDAPRFPPIILDASPRHIHANMPVGMALRGHICFPSSGGDWCQHPGGSALVQGRRWSLLVVPSRGGDVGRPAPSMWLAGCALFWLRPRRKGSRDPAVLPLSACLLL